MSAGAGGRMARNRAIVRVLRGLPDDATASTMEIAASVGGDLRKLWTAFTALECAGFIERRGHTPRQGSAGKPPTAWRLTALGRALPDAKVPASTQILIVKALVSGPLGLVELADRLGHGDPKRMRATLRIATRRGIVAEIDDGATKRWRLGDGTARAMSGAPS